MYARCAGGREEDCNIRLNEDDDHGIKCGTLSDNFFFPKSSTDRWVCTDHGEDGQCPSNYVAVASCASGRDSDCAWNGCSGVGRDVYTGLQCKQLGVLENFEWDEEGTTERFDITINAPSANPFVGCFNSLVVVESFRSATFTKNSASASEISTKLEATISAKYKSPTFGGASLNAEVISTSSVSYSNTRSTYAESTGTISEPSSSACLLTLFTYRCFFLFFPWCREHL